MDLIQLTKLMPDIFKIVKKDVEKSLGRHRAGLRLGLAEMGMFGGGFIGGMHIHPGTDIIMNISPLKIILSSQPYEIVWAYTYHILLHEYIHSLRFYYPDGKRVNLLVEENCRLATLNVIREKFKEADHPVIVLAEKGIGAFIPNLKITYIPPDVRPGGLHIDYVPGFDKESQTYFS
jgi:hypothetical protein